MKLSSNVCHRCRLICLKFYLGRISLFRGLTILGHSVHFADIAVNATDVFGKSVSPITSSSHLDCGITFHNSHHKPALI